ncbi:MAG: TonB-dependent receptor [Bryobacterales bacterium]|nr:TonB-dependent receptor [Bryobacterales bacterium]
MRTLRNVTLFLLLVATVVAQQDTGMITGQVTDPSGSPVPSAKIVLVNVATNAQTRVVTSNDGLFVATPIRIGFYSVAVEANGFKRAVRDGISLRVQDRLRVDFHLELGEVSESVSVTSEAPILQSETSSLGQVISTKPVSELPLNGRNFIQLIALTPGAYIPQRNNSLYQDFLIGINGNRIQNNNFLLDGINNNTTDNNQAPVLPSPDAIAEFKVQSNLLPAEFGRSLGGAINISLRSGTNAFHGTLFHFLRNNRLDANNFFNSGRPKPAFQQNQFGGALGGPVYLPKVYDGRNRTFWFANYQGTRIRKGLTRLFTAPTAAMRGGDFTGLSTLYDPETTSGNTRQPFAGNRIPATRFDPVMQRYLPLYPLPNRAGLANNYILNPKYSDNNDQGDVKLDHSFSASDSVMFRYSRGDREFIVPLNVPDVPFNGYFAANEFLPQVINNRGAVLSHTHTFSPRVINEARVGFNRLYATVTPRSQGKNLATEFGVRGVPDDRQSNGLTQVGITGFSALGDSFDTRRGQNVFQVLDNLTLISGRHSFKMGFDHRRTQFNLGQGSSPRGSFSYSGVFSQNPAGRTGTGNPFADFLMGYPDGASIGTNVRAGIRVRNYSSFIQDDWKATSRLTLNIGLRYEYTTPVTEVADRMANFNIAGNSVVLAKPGGIRERALANPDRNNFAPRFGLAYELNKKTVLRTGYGIFHTLEDAGHHNPAFNPPFSASFSYPSDQLNPATSLRPARGFPPVGFPGGNFNSLFININGRPFDFPAAYSQQWNFTLDRQIGQIHIETAYVGNKANKLMANRNINQPLPAAGTVNSRRIFPGWGNITFQEPRGNSIYHSLQTKVEKRFSKGHMFLLSHSWAKAIDDSDSTQLSTASGTGNLQDQRNLRAERSRSFQDVRNRLVLSYLYELPFGRGRSFLNNVSPVMDKMVGGWQVNGITFYQSGRAFTIASPSDHSNTGSSNIRPDATGISPDLPSDQRSPQRFINSAAFAIPAGFAFGNSGRNAGTGPSQTNFDFSVFKDFAFDGEGRRRLQFRAEFFNITNTPQFQIPNRTFNTPQFGTITETINDNRDVQLALRFVW